jgi:hypothetical protein
VRAPSCLTEEELKFAVRELSRGMRSGQSWTELVYGTSCAVELKRRSIARTATQRLNKDANAVAYRVLHLLMPAESAEAFLGDLEERHGAKNSLAKWIQIALSLRPLIVERIISSLRSLARQRQH